MTLIGLPVVLLLAAAFSTTYASRVLVNTCQDVNTCNPSTCTKLLDAPEGACTSLGSNNNSILNASYARFYCLNSVQTCSPTKVYFNDSTCSGTPAETLWIPCGTCLQFSPRFQMCDVVNDTFNVRVKSCNDNMCGEWNPYDNSGLPPATCYAHPGVPGLYLEYHNLEACAGILVEGFDDSSCMFKTAETLMPGQSKCFGGVSFNCSP